MAMPETAVNVDQRTVLRQNDIGLPRQVISMEPKAEPSGVKHPAELALGLCVHASDAAHNPAPLLL